MTEPAPAVYQPFPAFRKWADVVVDKDTLDRYFSIIDELRTRPETLDRAVQAATRAAAIDTGAIEGLYAVDRGFTMTVAVASAAWEALVNAREPVVRRSFEDALRAYDFVLDLATSRTEISEKAIREIHQIICAGQETYRVVTSLGVRERPLIKGEYKETPNNPTSRRTGKVHAYAPSIDVSAEMRRLVGELRSSEFTAAHPVLQAAWAHYAFVAIHPFADGNGRVARALSSVYLYSRPGVPLVVFADQKDEYLDGLQDADAGDPTRFVRFVEQRLIDVVGLVQVATQAPDRPVTSSIASLREALVGQHGLPHTELDTLANRLLDAATAELTRQVAELDVPDGVSPLRPAALHGVGMDAGYRPVPGRDTTEGVALVSGPPAGAKAQVDLGVRVRRNEAVGPVFQLLAFPRQKHLLVELREVFPILTTVLELKIRYWIQGLVAELLSDLDSATRATLKERGYL